MDKSDSIKNIAISMCKAQSEMGGAHKGANNPFFKSKYADLGSVVQAVKEPFAGVMGCRLSQVFQARMTMVTGLVSSKVKNQVLMIYHG